MKPPSFLMRYVGVVFVVLLLAIVSVRARAEERQPGEVNVTCVLSLAPDVQRLVQMHERGADYFAARHLVLTDPTNRDDGRWTLMQVLDRLHSGQLAPGRAITFLWGLCSLKERGGIEEKDEAERRPFDEGGMFQPIKDEGKDI